AAAEAIGERLALEVLHDQVVGLAFAADVVERADVRVRELRDRLGFALEPLADLLAGTELGGEDLDRDVAVEPGVASLVDLAHAAGGERGNDLVGPEPGSGGERHHGTTSPGPTSSS